MRYRDDAVVRVLRGELLEEGYDAVLGGEEILAAGRPRRGAHPIPGRPTGIGGERVEAASSPGPEIDFVQRVSHLHGQLEPSRDRLGGLDRSLERAREHGGDAFRRETLRNPRSLRLPIRPER